MRDDASARIKVSNQIRIYEDDEKEERIDEKFLRSTFTALVKRLSCFNRDLKKQEWSWNFFACQNSQNELGNFLDAVND